MTYLVVEDDFGPFIMNKQSYKPDPSDKILKEGTQIACQLYLSKLINDMVDDSPTEFWRDYNSTETGEGTTA